MYKRHGISHMTAKQDLCIANHCGFITAIDVPNQGTKDASISGIILSVAELIQVYGVTNLRLYSVHLGEPQLYFPPESSDRGGVSEFILGNESVVAISLMFKG